MRPFSQQTFWLITVGRAQVLQIPMRTGDVSQVPISHGGMTVSQACTKPAPWNWSTWVKFRVRVNYSHLCLYLNIAAGNLPDTEHKPCIYPLYKNIMPSNAVPFFCLPYRTWFVISIFFSVMYRSQKFQLFLLHHLWLCILWWRKNSFPSLTLSPPFWKGDWPGVRPLLGCMHLYQSLTETIG